MAPDHLHRIEQATAELKALRAATDEADRAWRKTISDALAAGVSATDIATTASISRARVYQIRDSRR